MYFSIAMLFDKNVLFNIIRPPPFPLLIGKHLQSYSSLNNSKFNTVWNLIQHSHKNTISKWVRISTKPFSLNLSSMFLFTFHDITWICPTPVCSYTFGFVCLVGGLYKISSTYSLLYTSLVLCPCCLFPFITLTSTFLSLFISGGNSSLM